MSTAFDTIQRGSAISFPALGVTVDPPAYITIFGKNIYFYGIIIALGFLLAIIYCAKHSKRFGIKEDDFYDTVLFLIPFSILGARAYFVLFRLDEYLADPLSIFAIREGGLAIYGGVIAGILTVALVCRHKKLRLTAMLDLLVFGLLIGQIVGRWGNFMNREAFGGETDFFLRMGLTAQDGTTIFVHPTFLYESLWNLGCFVFLSIFVKNGKRKYDGQCLLLYFLIYGVGRAWIEGLRTDSLYIGSTGVRASQLLSLALVIVSAAVLFVLSRRSHPADELYVNQVDVN